MKRRFREEDGSFSDTSFVVLDNQFAEVFKKCNRIREKYLITV